MERIQANKGERRRHIRALLTVHRLEFQRGYWVSSWNRVILIIFFLLLQTIMLLFLRQFMPMGHPRDMEIEAGRMAVLADYSPAPLIPGLSMGLQTTLLIIFGIGTIIAFLSCVLDINDSRLGTFPLNAQTVVAAEFLHQLFALALSIGPALVFVFARYCWTVVLQQSDFLKLSPAVYAAGAHIIGVVLLALFFGILLFLLMVFLGMTLSVLFSWLSRVVHWNLFATQADPLLFLGIAIILAVSLGFSVAERWSLLHNPGEGVVWIPLVGTIIVRALAGTGRLVTRLSDTWHGVWQMLLMTMASAVLFRLVTEACASRCAMMPEAHSHVAFRRIHTVHSFLPPSSPSMTSKDLHTFFRGDFSLIGTLRWSTIWVLMVFLFSVVYESSQPLELKQYWGSGAGMRIGILGLLLGFVLRNVAPFLLFYLVLAEQRATLLSRTIPVSLRRILVDKQVAALLLGEAGIVLWALCFARHPFRTWSPLLLLLTQSDVLVWYSILSCLLMPFLISRDEQKGIVHSVYAAPLMLGIVCLALIADTYHLLPPKINDEAFLLSAGTALGYAALSLCLGLVLLFCVAVPVSAFFLGRRLASVSAIQEAGVSNTVV